MHPTTLEYFPALATHWQISLTTERTGSDQSQRALGRRTAGRGG